MKKTFLLGALLVGLVPSEMVYGAPAVDGMAGVMAKTDANPAFLRPLQGEKRYAHVLDRLAFGPRPGDIEAVKQIGIKPWIERQLTPQTIDDSVLEGQLASLSWLKQPAPRLMLAYKSDTLNFLRQMKKADKGVIAAPVLTPAQQAQKAEIEAAGMDKGASLQALGQLTTNKLARAISSERQLQEVMVDFWSNHFNVDVNKGPVRSLKIKDEVDTIRPHVFGNFRELLGASAHSPAMLHYLDNARSTREGKARNGKTTGGLNENYGRELMELHTLGVDGGYTQDDVTQVAKCFTGWSVDRDSGEFFYRERAHDPSDKMVLGQRIVNGGEADGEKVLDILASHPSTARFIARKLCVRFVADEPPASLVDKVAAAFTRSKGDLPTVYRALFFSPEFLSEGAYRSKIKSPFEFTVSAVRALNGSLEVGGERANARLIAIGGSSLNRSNGMRRAAKRPLAVSIAAMGQPLFSCQAPTGYAEDSRKWVSSSALVARLNFALDLTGGRVGDVVLKEDTFRPAPVDTLAQNLLNGDVSPSTKATIMAEAQKAPDDGARLRALLLGSPEFQRR